MPYLQYVFCDKCKNVPVDIDDKATIEAYITEGRKSAFINQATLIWDYLIYKCPACQTRYKYTYKDVEMRTRNHFSELAEKYDKYFKDLAEQKLAEQERVDAPEPPAPTTKQRLDRLYKSKE